MQAAEIYGRPTHVCRAGRGRWGGRDDRGSRGDDRGSRGAAHQRPTIGVAASQRRFGHVPSVYSAHTAYSRVFSACSEHAQDFPRSSPDLRTSPHTEPRLRLGLWSDGLQVAVPFPIGRIEDDLVALGLQYLLIPVGGCSEQLPGGGAGRESRKRLREADW